jgi:carboxylesterase
MSLIIKGGEPFYFSGGRTGCLVVHGFTASPQEVRRLGQHLASKGHTVLGPRLFAHATKVRDLRRARWLDWLHSVQDGYHMLRSQVDQIFLVGLSLGGVLSLILASHKPVAGVVAMSTPYELPKQGLLKWIRPVLRPLSIIVPQLAKGPLAFQNETANRERVDYRARPLRTIIEVESCCLFMQRCLADVSAPTLLMHSRTDDFVPPDSMRKIYEALGSNDKQMHWIEESDHVMTVDVAAQEVFQAASTFIAGLIP